MNISTPERAAFVAHELRELGEELREILDSMDARDLNLRVECARQCCCGEEEDEKVN